MDGLIIFGSTFLAVFALGLQSLNVNQGHYAAAALTSVLISTGHIYLYELMPQATLGTRVGYFAGGIVGITASMWVHRRVRGWWKGTKVKLAAWWQEEGERINWPDPEPRRLDEHRDVGRCGLLRDDDKH